MWRRCVWILSAAMAFPLLVGGCGGGRQSADVSGRVVRDGKPVANVVVRFQPMVSDNRRDVGMASYGKTDSDGRFRLRFSDNDSSGALIGSHAVIIDDPSEHAADNADAGGIGKELRAYAAK